VLTSRRGLAAEGAAGLVAELSGLGASVDVVACDVADRDALAGVLAGHGLTAVVHTAGVLDDGTIESMSAERLDRVMRPKTDAALVLDELTRDADLAAFVLFSSIAGTFGGAGQGNYAAANAALDALATARAATGRCATSIAWGLWAESSGMTGDLAEADLRRMARAGMRALSTEQGLALFDAALAGPSPAVVAAGLDPRALRGADPAAVPPLLRALTGGTGRRAVAAMSPVSGPSLADRLAGLTEPERDQILLDLVREHTAVVLGHASTDEVPAGRAFKELGFDSLTAVELRNRLATATGLQLPATLAFDYPTPVVLTAHLRDRIEAPDGPVGSPLTAELDRLENTLSGAAVDDDVHAEVTSRLQTLLWKWTGARGTAQAPTVADELDSASDDEVFDFIGKELGIS
jgi:acyl carrier protein